MRGARLYDMIVTGVSYLQHAERRNPRPSRLNVLIIVTDGVDTTSTATEKRINELLGANRDVQVLTAVISGDVRCSELPQQLGAFDNECSTVRSEADVEVTLNGLLARLQRQRQ